MSFMPEARHTSGMEWEAEKLKGCILCHIEVKESLFLKIEGHYISILRLGML